MPVPPLPDSCIPSSLLPSRRPAPLIGTLSRGDVTLLEKLNNISSASPSFLEVQAYVDAELARSWASPQTQASAADPRCEPSPYTLPLTLTVT